MRLQPLVAGLMTMVIVCGCKSTAALEPTNSPLQLQWHLASEKHLPGFVNMSQLEVRKNSGTLWVAPEPILRLSDISNAARSNSGDAFLYLTVKVSARSGLQSDTAAHLRDLLALMLQGKIVYVAILAAPLSQQMIVRIGEDGISDAQAADIIQAVRDSGGAK